MADYAKRHYILHLTLLLLLLPAAICRVEAQGRTPEAVETLIRAHRWGAAADSLRQGAYSPADSLYYDALLAHALGRYEEALATLSKAPRREQSTLRLLALRLLAETALDQADAADKTSAQIKKLRLRHDHEKALAEQVLREVALYRRMRANARPLTIADTLLLPDLSALSAELERQPLGDFRVSEQAYETDQVRWEAAEQEQGAAFKLYNKLADGSWGEPLIVPIRGGEHLEHLSYPFVKSDGVTLYFSAEEAGNSLGARDLYVSRYNAYSREILVPQRLPMPFSSMADDLLYIEADHGKIGWTASARGVPPGAVKLITFLSEAPPAEEAPEVSEQMLRYAGLTIAPHAADALVRLHRVRQQASVPASAEAAPLFYIHDRPIRSATDLTTDAGRRLLDRLLQLDRGLQADRDALMKLRAALVSGVRSQESVRQEILARERRVRSEEEYRAALINEIILAERRR